MSDDAADDEVLVIDLDNFDFDDLELDAVLTVQEEMGVLVTDKDSMATLNEIQIIQVMVFLTKRGTDPNFPWEQSRRIKFGDIDMPKKKSAKKKAAAKKGAVGKDPT